MDPSPICEIQQGTEAEVCRELWGDEPKRKKDVTWNMRSYWQYFHQICDNALARHSALRTYQGVVDVARELKADAPRTIIQDVLRGKRTATYAKEEEMLDNSINLATSFLPMIDCGSTSV